MRKKYTMSFHFNGIKKRKYTDNIEEAIMAVAPETLVTDLYINIRDINNGMESERHLSLRDGKRLFINEDFRQVFISNLLMT